MIYPVLVLTVLAVVCIAVMGFAAYKAFVFRKKTMGGDLSKYGIRLPAPKIGLPESFQTEEALSDWLHARTLPTYSDQYRAAIRLLSKSWRIERSRADDLERMVDILQAENARLRKPSWFSRLVRRSRAQPPTL